MKIYIFSSYFLSHFIFLSSCYDIVTNKFYFVFLKEMEEKNQINYYQKDKKQTLQIIFSNMYKQLAAYFLYQYLKITVQNWRLFCQTTNRTLI